MRLGNITGWAALRPGQATGGHVTASPTEQVSLTGLAVCARLAARTQAVAIVIASMLAALLGLIAVALPDEDRLVPMAALATVVVLGGLAVGLTDLWIGQSLAALVWSGSQLRQSAAERAADLARLNAELRKRDQDCAALFAMMSHELRTPLNAIVGYSRLLLDDLDGPLNEEQRADAAQIHEGGLGLLRIVNGTLDLARLDAGAVSVDLGPVQIWAVAEEVVALLRPLADEKGLSLTSTVSPNLPPVLANEERLRQVLVNLVGNAVKFTPGGAVTVGAHAADDRVSIVVEDTGVGIAPSDQARIFEPFRQADEGRARTHEGTGLGLAIAQRLVQLMGGTIHLESEPNAGSAFTVSLGRAGRPRAILRQAPVTAEPGDAADVLIVAEQARASALVSALAGRGLAATVCDVSEWQRQLTSTQPATVLVDARLPRAAAWRVLRELRAWAHGEHGPRVRVGLLGLGMGITGEEVATCCNVLLPAHLEVVSAVDLDSELAELLRGQTDGSCSPVLVVGADPGWRRRVTMLVQGVGLGVREAAYGDGALTVARCVPISAVVVDLLVGSPGIMEVLAELQAAVGRRTCPIFVVTPTGLAPSHQRDLQLGAASWLTAAARASDQAAAEIASVGRIGAREIVRVGGQ